MFCTSQNYYHCECSTYLCVAIEQLNEGLRIYTEKNHLCHFYSVHVCHNSNRENHSNNRFLGEVEGVQTYLKEHDREM